MYILKCKGTDFSFILTLSTVHTMEENSDFHSVQSKKKTPKIVEKCLREEQVSHETFLFTKKDQICFDALTLNWKGNH